MFPVAVVPADRRRLGPLGAMTRACAWALAGCLLLAGCAREPLIRDRRVMVMDFENAIDDPAQSHLSGGLAEMMTSQLVNYPRVAVIERQDVAAYFDKARTDPQRWHELGRKSNIDYFIIGSIARLEDNYVLNARILSVATGQIVSGSSVTRSCAREEDIYPTMQAVTRAIARNIQVLAERFDRLATGGEPAVATAQ
ncbi:MAG: hypothetical protein BWZ08_00495 [candidate division BRC1 bacterium ADurb.BinA292]|nr:MAG: hypothetical protein BWZ08_00495 [candidate division BRC1 bacterium ADurb.BinA292]